MSDSENEDHWEKKLWDKLNRQHEAEIEKMCIDHQTFINSSPHELTILKVYIDSYKELYVTTDCLPLKIVAEFKIKSRDSLDILEYIKTHLMDRYWCIEKPYHNITINQNGKAQLICLDDGYLINRHGKGNDDDGYLNELICRFYQNPIAPVSLFSQAGKCALLNTDDRCFLKKLELLPSYIISRMEGNLIKLRYYKTVLNLKTAFLLNFGDPIDPEIEITVELEKSLFEKFKRHFGHHLTEKLETEYFEKPYWFVESCCYFVGWGEFVVAPEYETMTLETFREIVVPLLNLARNMVLDDVFKRLSTSKLLQCWQ